MDQRRQGDKKFTMLNDMIDGYDGVSPLNNRLCGVTVITWSHIMTRFCSELATSG